MCAKAPGLELKEVDISTIVRGPSTSIGALVGKSARGKENARVLITSTKQFVEEFGEPVPGNYFHYTALAFLQESSILYCVRALNSDLSTLYGGVLIQEDGASPDNEAFAAGVADPSAYSFVGEPFIIVGDNPGVWNNSIRVKISDTDVLESTFKITVEYRDPDTGTWSEVETYTVSRIKLKKDGFGKSAYIEDVINDTSAYIRVVDNTSLDETALPKEQTVALQFGGGASGSDPTASNVATAWDLFANKNAVKVNILMAGGWSDAVVINKMVNNIAAVRQDAVAILDPPAAENTVSKVVVWRNALTGVTYPSYAALYYPWVKDTDEYNDKPVELPPSGYVGAVYAKTDRIANVYSAPYGLNRGVLPVTGVVEEVDEGEADVLYTAQINPIYLESGVGVVVWGQRTLQAKESALSGMNVRRLLNYSETASLDTLKYYIGENNTEFVRAQIKQALDTHYLPLVAKGAYYDAQVECNEDNNTPDVIDRNELVVDIYVQPVRVADRILVKVVVTRTGVSLQELASGAVL